MKRRANGRQSGWPTACLTDGNFHLQYFLRVKILSICQHFRLLSLKWQKFSSSSGRKCILSKVAIWNFTNYAVNYELGNYVNISLVNNRRRGRKLSVDNSLSSCPLQWLTVQIKTKYCSQHLVTFSITSNWQIGNKRDRQNRNKRRKRKRINLNTWPGTMNLEFNKEIHPYYTNNQHQNENADTTKFQQLSFL